MAHRTEAIETKDLERVAVDTTVQEKAIAHPTDARLVLHAKALHGNPYDGHTLDRIIALRSTATRATAATPIRTGSRFGSAARSAVSPKLIRREMRRRAAVEPVIGHLKDDHRMRRNHLKGRDGDRINAVLAAAGYNFSLLLRWFKELLRALFLVLGRPPQSCRFTFPQRPKTFFPDAAPSSNVCRC